MRKLTRAVLALVVGATVLSGCLFEPGDVSRIQFVSTTTAGGWRYDFYRNLAYPCAISGYQTFVIGTRVGSDPAAVRPLHVKMHGGGVGYFAPDGSPQPDAANKTEESRASLINRFDDGLMALVQAAPEDFRAMAVSMCSHDIYAGTNTPDPNNPNLTPEGDPRPTNGLLATKAAIQFAMATYPTDGYFLHGGSAGSAGTFHVAWSLQAQTPPAGIIADSGVLNQLYEAGQIAQGLPCARSAEAVAIVPQRFDPLVADADNRPDLLVSRGWLTTPIMHVWNHADPNVCGSTPMTCTRPDGSALVLASADCAHEPMRLAIEAHGPTSRSENLAVCVDNPARVGACDRHVVTTTPSVNTDPAAPANYNQFVLDWMRTRLADD